MNTLQLTKDIFYYSFENKVENNDNSRPRMICVRLQVPFINCSNFQRTFRLGLLCLYFIIYTRQQRVFIVVNELECQ